MLSRALNSFFRANIIFCLLISGSLFFVGCSQGPGEYKPKVLEEARIWKSKIESDIQYAVEEAHKIASSLEAMKNNASPSREAANKLIKETLEKHDEYLGIWTCWEPNAFDNADKQYRNTLGHDKTGRFIPYWNRLSGKINVLPLNYDFEGKESIYQTILASGKDLVSIPIEYSIGDNKGQKVIYAVPIRYDGKVVGATGIDLTLSKFFYPIIRQVRVLDIAYGFLVDDRGVLIAHPSKWANVGRSLESFAFEPHVIQAVKDGHEVSQIKVSKTTGNTNYYQFVPIKIGSTDKKWSLAISLRPDRLNGRGPKIKW